MNDEMDVSPEGEVRSVSTTFRNGAASEAKSWNTGRLALESSCGMDWSGRILSINSSFFCVSMFSSRRAAMSFRRVSLSPACR